MHKHPRNVSKRFQKNISGTIDTNSLVNKYTYSTDTWTVPTTPTGQSGGKQGWGTGNTEFAVYGQGYPNPGWGSNIYKYEAN